MHIRGPTFPTSIHLPFGFSREGPVGFGLERIAASQSRAAPGALQRPLSSSRSEEFKRPHRDAEYGHQIGVPWCRILIVVQITLVPLVL